MSRTALDLDQLDVRVKDMYRLVAQEPHGRFHFEVGRDLATRLGYEPGRLAAVPAAAVDSFAGVGYFFELASLREGETVVDLGSGAGMDAFYAAALVGPAGTVIGVDFTQEQLAKARRSAAHSGLGQLEFREGRIEALPVADSTADCVISNGVINLCPDKASVFAEAARVLKPGGRLAIADIVTDEPLSEAVTCSAELWASCIGGAPQQDDYLSLVADAGLTVTRTRPNTYEFLSDRARNASSTYGVKSVSLLAVKPR